MSAPEDRVGTALCGTYQLERLLGSGSMGAVYAAVHLRTGGRCAVKVLHSDCRKNADIYRRFQDEARIASSLQHPNIVHVMDLNEDESGTPFIVMELLEGEDLGARLDARGRLSLPEALIIARQVGSALQATHDRGIVHRDIKPQNIFLVRVETAAEVTEFAKVVDFGISKIRRSASQATHERAILGTPNYMAPEAAMGLNRELDGRADQWSLAVIMYQALAGVLPFTGGDNMALLYNVVHAEPVPLATRVPTLPPHVTGAVTRALLKRPEERFPRVIDFVRALEGALLPPQRRRVGSWLLLGTGGLAATALFTGWLLHSRSVRPVPPAPPVAPAKSGSAASDGDDLRAPLQPDLSTQDSGVQRDLAQSDGSAALDAGAVRRDGGTAPARKNPQRQRPRKRDLFFDDPWK